MPPQLLPIPSGYLTRGGRAHLILHPPKDILKVFHWVIIMQPLIRHAVEGLYDSQCAETIRVNLGQIKFSQIPWTNLTEEASNLIGPFELYWSNIKNMVLTWLSFWSIIWVNWMRPFESIDESQYSTLSTLHLSPWLRWRLVWFNWSFKPYSVISMQNLNELGFTLSNTL